MKNKYITVHRTACAKEGRAADMKSFVMGVITLPEMMKGAIEGGIRLLDSFRPAL